MRALPPDDMTDVTPTPPAAPLALFLMTLPEPGPTAQSFSLMRRA